MKTAHIVRPHYPTYRDSSRLTAKKPVAELVFSGLLIGCILFGALTLAELYWSMVQA